MHRRRRRREEREQEWEEEEERLRVEAEKAKQPKPRNPFYAEMAKMQLEQQIALEDAQRKGLRLDEKGMSREEIDEAITRYTNNK